MKSWGIALLAVAGIAVLATVIYFIVRLSRPGGGPSEGDKEPQKPVPDEEQPLCLRQITAFDGTSLCSFGFSHLRLFAPSGAVAADPSITPQTVQLVAPIGASNEYWSFDGTFLTNDATGRCLCWLCTGEGALIRTIACDQAQANSTRWVYDGSTFFVEYTLTSTDEPLFLVVDEGEQVSGLGVDSTLRPAPYPGPVVST